MLIKLMNYMQQHAIAFLFSVGAEKARFHVFIVSWSNVILLKGGFLLYLKKKKLLSLHQIFEWKLFKGLVKKSVHLISLLGVQRAL